MTGPDPIEGATPRQQGELHKYRVAYQSPGYRMSQGRMDKVRLALAELPWRGTYLDVSCGRGETLQLAWDLGYSEPHGTETVPELVGPEVELALAWALPFADGAYDLVTMFDVLEHLLPGDDERAVRELLRVARRCVMLTANNRHSIHDGVELHVNRRLHKVWHGLLTEWAAPAKVTWAKHLEAKGSEMWIITK